MLSDVRTLNARAGLSVARDWNLSVTLLVVRSKHTDDAMPQSTLGEGEAGMAKPPQRHAAPRVRLSEISAVSRRVRSQRQYQRGQREERIENGFIVTCFMPIG